MDLRRLEEISQNASRPERGLMIDGWSVGLSPGLAKRSRCVNPFYACARPFEVNLDAAQHAYAMANLPCIFRLTPFSPDPRIDQQLATAGYLRFDTTLVQAVSLTQANFAAPSVPAGFTLQDEPDLTLAARLVAAMRGDSASETDALIRRWSQSAVHISALFAYAGTHHGSVSEAPVARLVSILEDGHVGIFDVGTQPAWRNRGLATAHYCSTPYMPVSIRGHTRPTFRCCRITLHAISTNDWVFVRFMSIGTECGPTKNISSLKSTKVSNRLNYYSNPK